MFTHNVFSGTKEIGQCIASSLGWGNFFPFFPCDGERILPPSLAELPDEIFPIAAQSHFTRKKVNKTQLLFCRAINLEIITVLRSLPLFFSWQQNCRNEIHFDGFEAN
jgi:hypothetical protein